MIAAAPSNQPLLELRHVVKRFAAGRSGWFKPMRHLHAVDDVSISIAPGTSLGLVGESGCGKSTLARLIARLMDSDEGEILFQGQNLQSLAVSRFARSATRAEIQMVFQDPGDSLNPRFTAFDSIAEPLKLLRQARAGTALNDAVAAAAAEVGLPLELLPRFGHQLSGGQKARVGIARAIALRPKLLVLDEPTAALDVSVQSVVLQLLADLRQRLGMSYLLISHDLNVIRLLCDQVVVMYLGKVVETGNAQQVFERPAHPYTEALVRSIPKVRFPIVRRSLDLGEAQSPIDPDPRRCRYVGRCAYEQARCVQTYPATVALAHGRSVACISPRLYGHPLV